MVGRREGTHPKMGPMNEWQNFSPLPALQQRNFLTAVFIVLAEKPGLHGRVNT